MDETKLTAHRGFNRIREVMTDLVGGLGPCALELPSATRQAAE